MGPNCIGMLQSISLISFPRLGHINSSTSIPCVLCFSFLPSFHMSLLQVVMTLLSVHIGWLTQKESPVPAVTIRFYWKMPDQLPTHRKDSTTCKYVRNLWMLALMSPSNFSVLLPDVYAQHSSATTQLFLSLQVSPNSSRCVFTWAIEHTLSLTNISSTYE